MNYAALAKAMAKDIEDRNEGPLAPGLYVAATPIGHAGDLTLRALQTLLRADRILCEDTRVTAKLLALYGIEKPLTAYHDHNGARMRPRILADLEAGQALVLVSDAGLPLISDPGFPLLQAVREAGHRVEILPGANAALTALAHSGLAPDRFYFGGFLPPKKVARTKALTALKGLEATLIFYEAPRRLAEVLGDALEVFRGGEAVVARELTKKFEEIRRGPLADMAAFYEAGEAPKGEVVLLLAPAVESEALTEEEVTERLRERLGAVSLKQAVAEVSELSLLPRRQVYDMALALKREADET